MVGAAGAGAVPPWIEGGDPGGVCPYTGDGVAPGWFGTGPSGGPNAGPNGLEPASFWATNAAAWVV